MKYRLTFYDKQMKYKSHYVLGTVEDVYEKLRTNHNYYFFTVHKCNDKGNNYSGREVTLDFIER